LNPAGPDQDLGAELALALDLADAADAITLARFQALDLKVDTKPDLTPVSEADRAVEHALRDRIRSARPAHAVVGEEYGVDGPDGASHRWIIDPIDGTKGYVRGLPVWATLIALEVDGEMAVGVASAPALGHRWWAARGQGAVCDGSAIRVSAVSDLSDAHLSYGSERAFDDIGVGDRFRALAARCWRTRGFGDFWSHVLVAEGRVDVGFDPEVSLWDLAALQVIVEEAGGRFTDFTGTSRADGGSAISSNGLLHDQVLSALSP
jgi:histidinol-phosphatase